MNNYIGFKLIKAEPMTKIEFDNKFKGLKYECDYVDQEGYHVQYPDGYDSWSPKEVFEKTYLEVTPNPNLTNSDISISKQMVDDFIKEYEVTTLGDKNTVVRAILKNGFEIIEYSACVSPANYSEEIGAEICLNKIKDKIWSYLGFLLQTASNGIK